MPKAKYIKLSEDVLALYYRTGREMAELKKKHEDLRRQIMEALHAKRKPDPSAPFTCELSSYDKESIPWEEEANRWKKLAMKLAEDAGKDAVKWVKRYTVAYPKVPVERLTIVPKKAKEEEEAK